MDNILLEVGGKEYYIDVDALSACISVEKKSLVGSDNEEIHNKHRLNTGFKVEYKVENEGGLQIDVAKYEIYRDLLNTVLTTNEIFDEKLGVAGLNSLPIPFKLSFNTLLIKRIIKEL